MIKAVNIKNFQSHKETHLDFDKGINVIIGNTDSGKTAILRSLYWIFENRPLGQAFVSSWIKDEKGNIKDECFSEILLSNNTKIKRAKTNKDNSYILDDVSLDAIGTSVPEEIQKALAIQPENVSKQMDSPFLISDSPSDVARFLNKIIHVDIIDKIFSLVEKEKRGIKKEISIAEKTITELDETINNLSWVDKAKKINEKIKVLIDEINEANNMYSTIVDQIKEYEEANKIVKEYSSIISELESYYNEYVKIKKEKEEQESLVDFLQNTIVEYVSAKETLDKTIDLEKASKYMDKIVIIQKEIQEDKKTIDVLSESIKEYKKAFQIIKDVPVEIQRLEAQLPNTCPLCGNKLKEK